MELQFLAFEDLETRVFEDYLVDSEQEDIEATQNIEKQAISLVKSKLRKRYDTDVIFTNANYAGRDLIIWAVSGIVSYRLIRRNAARKMPSDLKDEYQEVMAWLNSVRDGNENPELPMLPEDEQKGVLWGNSTNQNQYL
ncbi:DUF1320 domain-containing protein [Gramella lutea]|uniref:DUF1320 domain-containing protein n=1 Tax=Christiangramia lutea TaxID=1607951 RepID=A0A9X1V5Z9_9FLAO|nr:phage protein Gp36 family protein [Christiangramia lutea]MCH4824286.1 DUF1320 domain-containing protein [Christiangramia lutea]